ncbi:MAG TPA: DNA translocase FtsK 4TM domain-containing protein, partial [Roseomonas sp.]
MPRAASDPDSRSSANPRLDPRRFASPAVRAVLRRRMAELIGLLFALVALALSVALLTYNPADPSLNTATYQATRNLAGPVGAILSDLLLQGFGVAGGLPVLCLLAWAWRLATQRGLGTFPLRLIGLLAGLPLAAAAAALLPLPAGFPAQAGAGGAIGTPIAHAIVQGLASAFGPFGTLLGMGLVGLLALIAVFLACGLSGGEWRGAGRAALGGARVAAGAGVVAAGAAGRLARASARGIGDLRASGRDGDPHALDHADDDAPERDARTRLSRPAPAAEPERPGFLRRGLGALLGRRQRPVQVPLQEMLRNADAAAAAGPPVTMPEPPASIRRPAPPPVMADEEEDEVAPPPPRLQPASRPKVAPPVEAKRSKAAQPGLDLGETGFKLPPVDLLVAAPARRSGGPSEDSLQANARLLESVLDDYGVRGRIAEIRPGPVVTLYELEPAPGTKSARVIGLADDIARSMSVVAVRIATVPGRNVIGIEMPNAKRETVFFSEMMLAEDWARTPGKLNLALGKDIGGTPVVADLARMPHLLIAGTTGSGKSVAVNTMILSLLFRMTPDECRFIMIDPKMLELSVYDRIPHLLAPVVTEPAKAIGALKWTVREMERRYRLMSQLGVRNIAGYNEKLGEARKKGVLLTRKVQTGIDPETRRPTFEEEEIDLNPLPFIVVIIDEMADLMLVAGKEIEAAVQRLAQMARAAGIHVVMATQRPSVDVITGTIKANFPTRISFQVTSKIDSRTI